MTPAARIAASIDILSEIARGNAPADAVLVDWFRGHRFAGSGDRRAIRDGVYRDLRRGALLRWSVAEAGGDADSPRARTLADLALERPGDIDSLFSGAGYGPPALTGEERSVVSAVSDLDPASAPAWCAGNCPEALYPLFTAQWGAEAATELAALNTTAPVDLRVNRLRATREAARARLLADGYESDPTPHSPEGLRGSQRGNFGQLGAYREGLIEPQDESSQLVARLVDARPEQRIVDYCAGAGGKVLALAAAADNGAELVACDVSAARLARMAPRAERLGVENLRPRPVPADGPPGELHAWADRVLVDAPCSGTGTWRRSPDLRWRTTAATIEAYAHTQDELLDRAAIAVKPGGRLIYAACSVLDREGRDRVTAFLDRNSDYRRLAVARILGDETAAALGCNDELVLTPARHGTDGMYAAILERAS